MNTVATTGAPTVGSARSTLPILSQVRLRPRYEGTNIGTWMGFKHVNYLVEEAVLGYLRQAGQPVGQLYERYGLCVDVVDIDTRIRHALRIDDVVVAEVRPNPKAADDELACTVAIHVGDGAGARSVSAKVRVALRRDPLGGAAEPAPSALAPYVVDRLGVSWPGCAPIPPQAGEDVLDKLSTDHNAFVWKWRIPYFYCHFSAHVQMSGYLRLMEEVVHLFLLDRGVSVKKLLDEHGWIPAVPRSRITILDEAHMEEELYTVFTVEDVFKQLTYTARMDCHVLRDGVVVPTATGRITHGYAKITSRTEWGLVEFDDRLTLALGGAAQSVAQGAANGRGEPDVRRR